MNDAFDVAIVGAGPAGSSTAYHLAKRGRRVVLLDRSAFPRDKACGDGLTRRAVQLLNELGLTDQLAPHQRVAGRRLITDAKGHRDFRYSPAANGLPDYGVVVRRLDLDHLLVQKAIEAGAVLSENSSVTGPIVRADRVCGVRVRSQSGDREISATFVVAADGAHSPLARRAGLVTPDTWSIGFALRGYFTGIADVSSLFSFYIPLIDPASKRMVTGYGWVFPTSTSAANIGAGFLPSEPHDRGLNLRAIFDAFVRDLREADDRFRAMRLAGPLRGAPVFVGFKPSQCAGRGLIVTGDAAGLVDPSTGEGIGTALESGHLAAQVLDLALARRNPIGADLRVYSDTLETRFQDRFALRRNQARRFRFVWKLLENTFDIDRPVFQSVRHALVDHEVTGDRHLESLPSDTRWLQTTATADEVKGVRRRLAKIVDTDLPCLAEVCTDLEQSAASVVRSALVFLAARCGSLHRPSADALATSVELAHLALMLHDAVLDKAGGGREVRWPNQFTVMAGDYLLARAYSLAASLGTEIAQGVCHASAAVYTAKMWESGAYDAATLEAQHLALIEKKVATFYELACRLGGQVSHAPIGTVRQLAAFGRNIGIAVALTDEILDVVIEVDTPLAHPIVRLLENDARSWPMLLMLRHQRGDAFRAVVSRRPLDVVQVREALAMLNEGGVLADALALARRFAADAKGAIAGLADTRVRHSLEIVADFVIDRVPALVGDVSPSDSVVAAHH
jgi:geranylgeranyl reductase family protein